MTLNLNDFDVLVFDIGKIKLAPQLFPVTARFVDSENYFGLSYFLDMIHVWIHLIFCLDIYLPCTHRIAIITHIAEGTVCPISFVKDVLVSCAVLCVLLHLATVPSSVFRPLPFFSHAPPPSAPPYRSGPGAPYGSHQISSQPLIPNLFGQPPALTSTSRRPSCRTRSCQVAQVSGVCS